MLKIISVSLMSVGLAAGAAFAQSAGGTSTPNKVDPGPMHAPQKTDDTVTNSTRTNCAPNMQTNKTKSMTNKDGSASTPAGEAGVNTDGQSSSC